jgi:aryl-alcohol dehydrogenase-like predicted oxidoreductase
VDIAQLALQFSIAHPQLTSCVTGSANPQRVREWARWAAQPLDRQLLAEVQQILAPIHNWVYQEGLVENNDRIPGAGSSA